MSTLKDSLFAASKYGRLDDIKDIIQESADLNMVDELGNTPLHYAASMAYIKQLPVISKTT